jgi:hypothetical protein
MSTSIDLTFTVASFPVGWTGDYNQFAAKLVSLMEAVLQGNIMPGLYSQSVVTLPTSDVGPIFMGGQLYLWNVTTASYQIYSPPTPVTRSYNILDNADFQVWQRNAGVGTAVAVGPEQWWTLGTVTWKVASGDTVPAVGNTRNVNVVSSAGAVAGSNFYPGNNVVTVNGDELSITAVPDGTHITFTNTGGGTAGNAIPNNSLLRVRQKCYLADRWAVIQDGTITTPPTQQLFQSGILGGRAQNNPNTSNCLRITSNATPVTPTNTQYCIIIQRIELQRAQVLWDITPSLEFWVRSSIGGTFCAFLQSAGGDRSYVMPCTVHGGGGWQQFSFPAIVAIPYSAGSWGVNPSDFSMIFGICLSSGSNFQQSPSADNIWQTGQIFSDTSQANLLGTAGATFDIDLLQLEPSSTPTAFQYVSFPQQLSNCQRYCSKSYPYGTAVGNAGGGAGGFVMATTPITSLGLGGPSSLVMGNVRFPREMRQSPLFCEIYSAATGEFFNAIPNNSSGAGNDVVVNSIIGLDATGFVGLGSNATFNQGNFYSAQYLAEDGLL